MFSKLVSVLTIQRGNCSEWCRCMENVFVHSLHGTNQLGMTCTHLLALLGSANTISLSSEEHAWCQETARSSRMSMVLKLNYCSLDYTGRSSLLYDV